MDRSPHPSPQSSRPSGQSFFQSSRNVEVTSSNFSTTQGHHANVIINLNQMEVGHPSDDDNAQRTAQSSGLDQQQRSLPAQNCATCEMSVASSSQQTQRSSDIYARQLIPKGRGFPLWIPEPHCNLPIQYRRRGVEIGDVGIITPRGNFSFLFNIFAPVDPVSRVPEGFSPLSPSPQARDISKLYELNPGSYLASSSISKSECDSASGMTFKMSASEGAVLAMPEGATSEDFQNIRRIKRYVTANLADWYRYVNDHLGQEARNGDIRVVVGCDKSTSYGMAAVANATQEMNSQLRLRSLQNHSNSEAPVSTYTWEHSGVAETRAGPDSREVQELRDGDQSPPEDGKYRNQCLFLRTINPVLGEMEWLKLCRELDTPHLVDSSHNNNKPTNHDHDRHDSRRNSPSSPSSRPSRENRPPSSRANLSYEGSLASSLTPSFGVWMSNPPTGISFHPSEAINRMLFLKVPDAKIVITEDSNWCTIFKESDHPISCDEELLERVLENHHVEEDNGVVFLQSKNRTDLFRPHSPIFKEDEFGVVGMDDLIKRTLKMVKVSDGLGFLAGVVDKVELLDRVSKMKIPELENGEYQRDWEKLIRKSIIMGYLGVQHCFDVVTYGQGVSKQLKNKIKTLEEALQKVCSFTHDATSSPVEGFDFEKGITYAAGVLNACLTAFQHWVNLRCLEFTGPPFSAKERDAFKGCIQRSCMGLENLTYHPTNNLGLLGLWDISWVRRPELELKLTPNYLYSTDALTHLAWTGNINHQHGQQYDRLLNHTFHRLISLELGSLDSSDDITSLTEKVTLFIKRHPLIEHLSMGKGKSSRQAFFQLDAQHLNHTCFPSLRSFEGYPEHLVLLFQVHIASRLQSLSLFSNTEDLSDVQEMLDVLHGQQCKQVAQLQVDLYPQSLNHQYDSNLTHLRQRNVMVSFGDLCPNAIHISTRHRRLHRNTPLLVSGGEMSRDQVGWLGSGFGAGSSTRAAGVGEDRMLGPLNANASNGKQDGKEHKDKDKDKGKPTDTLVPIIRPPDTPSSRIYVDTVPPHPPAADVEPYWEGWVRSLRVVWRSKVDVQAAYYGYGHGFEWRYEPGYGYDRGYEGHAHGRDDHEGRREQRMEWRERWVVVRDGVVKMCKNRDDPTTTHTFPLSALVALRGAEHLAHSVAAKRHSALASSAPQRKVGRSDRPLGYEEDRDIDVGTTSMASSSFAAGAGGGTWPGRWGVNSDLRPSRALEEDEEFWFGVKSAPGPSENRQRGEEVRSSTIISTTISTSIYASTSTLASTSKPPPQTQTYPQSQPQLTPDEARLRLLRERERERERAERERRERQKRKELREKQDRELDHVRHWNEFDFGPSSEMKKDKGRDGGNNSDMRGQREYDERVRERERRRARKKEKEKEREAVGGSGLSASGSGAGAPAAGSEERQTGREKRERAKEEGFRALTREMKREMERERERDRERGRREYIPASREEAEAAGMHIVCAKFRMGRASGSTSAASASASGGGRDAGGAAEEERGGEERDASRKNKDKDGPRTASHRRDNRGEWIVLDMRNDNAFDSILKILHRHFVPPIVSSFIPPAVADPVTERGHGQSLRVGCGVANQPVLTKANAWSSTTPVEDPREQQHLRQGEQHQHTSDADLEHDPSEHGDGDGDVQPHPPTLPSHPSSHLGGKPEEEEGQQTARDEERVVGGLDVSDADEEEDRGGDEGEEEDGDGDDDDDDEKEEDESEEDDDLEPSTHPFAVSVSHLPKPKSDPDPYGYTHKNDIYDADSPTNIHSLTHRLYDFKAESYALPSHLYLSFSDDASDDASDSEESELEAFA